MMRKKIAATGVALGLGVGVVALATPASAATEGCHLVSVADTQGGGSHLQTVCDPPPPYWNGPVYSGGGTF